MGLHRCLPSKRRRAVSDRTGGSENGPRKNRAGRQATGILKTLRAGPWRPAPLLFDSAKTSPGNAQEIWRAISPRSARLRFGAAWFKPRRLSGGNPTHGNGNDEVGLHLRRRQGRGQGGDARPPRRQGREPRRDGQPRPAGAARLHHHDRGLHLLLRPTAAPIPPSSKAEVDDGARACRQDRRHDASATPANPLLVSVRSGARASMPGMMDTVLNLGLNDETVEALAAQSGDARFAYDSYRRFIHDVCERRARRRPRPLRGRARATTRSARATRSTPTSRPTTGKTLIAALQGDRREGARQALPAGSARAALGRDRRRVRLAG